MSIRRFIFCDLCNPKSIRHIEERRRSRHDDPTMGRRLSDGRAWFDGSEVEAEEAGWLVETNPPKHICPHCLQRGLHKMPAE